ncbi:hypothetical protein HDE_07870 [Halotydeus destructor]|nr:hypothetical protein HDE_07870 [Halotydeus destructor]
MAEQSVAEPSKLRQALKISTVEPYIFFIFIAFMVKQNTFTQFFQDKISRKEPEYQDLKDEILKDANELASYQAVIRSVPGIFFTILLAPWADKVRGARRKLMIWSALGQIADSILGLIAVKYEDTMAPWTVLLIGIPSSLAGGLLSVNIAAMGYASMTTPTVLMSLRFIILETVINASRPSSSFLSGQLLNTTSWMANKVRNFTAVYSLTLCAGIMALIWSVKFLDSRDCKDDVDQDKTEPYTFFNKENLSQILKMATKPRENKGRTVLWLLVIINALSISVMIGVAVVDLSYVQKQYGWDVVGFNTTNGKLTVCTLVAFALGSPLLASMLKLTNEQIGLFGLSSGTLKIITYVEASEKSAAFALMNIVQNIVALAFTMYFQQVINATITTMPGLCFQLSTVAFLVSMVCFIWIDFNGMKSKKANIEKKEYIENTRL